MTVVLLTKALTNTLLSQLNGNTANTGVVDVESLLRALQKLRKLQETHKWASQSQILEALGISPI